VLLRCWGATPHWLHKINEGRAHSAAARPPKPKEECAGLFGARGCDNRVPGHEAQPRSDSSSERSLPPLFPSLFPFPVPFPAGRHQTELLWRAGTSCARPVNMGVRRNRHSRAIHRRGTQSCACTRPVSDCANTDHDAKTDAKHRTRTPTDRNNQPRDSLVPCQNGRHAGEVEAHASRSPSTRPEPGVRYLTITTFAASREKVPGSRISFASIGHHP